MPKVRAVHVAALTAALCLVLGACAAQQTTTGSPNGSAAAATSAGAAVSVRATAPAASATTLAPLATDTPAATPVPTATVTPSATLVPSATAQPMAAPLLDSPTDPDPSAWYSGGDVTVTWTVPGPVAAAGFGYAVDASANAEAPAMLVTQARTVTLHDLKDGTWYVHLRAMGAAGQWGPTTTRRVNLDRAPLTLSPLRFSLTSFNPDFFQQQVAFDVSRPASVNVVVASVDGAAVRSFTLQQGQAGEVNVSWDGKDNAGQQVPAGAYSYAVAATDLHGHHATAAATDLGVTDARIVISLNQQRLVAYDGDTPLFSSLVTTGNPALPTPLGVFPILAKLSPFTFHSPWPKGDPYWYADSPTTYAMLFDDRGYFIHDAPWRHNFGPGSNQTFGTPGQDYTGSHGCVNVPYDMAQKLFNWAPVGTAVQVVQQAQIPAELIGTATPTASPTATATASATATATATATSALRATPSPAPTATRVSAPLPTVTATVTAKSTAVARGTATPLGKESTRPTATARARNGR